MGDEFRQELRKLINKHSMENGSDTPDFILADYMRTCLEAFDAAVSLRTKWYGKDDMANGKDSQPSVLSEPTTLEFGGKEGLQKEANDNRSPDEKKRDVCCTLAGSGRGDCEHFVGFPEKFEYPETVDEWGRPHGWCFYCWQSQKLSRAKNRIRKLESELRPGEKSKEEKDGSWRPHVHCERCLKTGKVELGIRHKDRDLTLFVSCLRRALDNLIWCSGSPDFGPEGQAHEGWVKGPQETIGRLTVLLQNLGEMEPSDKPETNSSK